MECSIRDGLFTEYMEALARFSLAIDSLTAARSAGVAELDGLLAAARAHHASLTEVGGRIERHRKEHSCPSRCEFCGKETLLYENSKSICIGCSEQKDTNLKAMLMQLAWAGA